MKPSASRPTRLLLEARAKALKEHLPKAIDGDGIGVHHARVASRRLREVVPVLAEDLKGNKPRKAERKIRRLTRALGAVRELDVTLTVLGERLAKRGKSLLAAIRDAGQLYNPERLHQVRIETKKLRYGLEIAAESGIRSAAPLVRQLRKAQDTLGRLHDLQVLQEHVAAVQTKPPTRQVPAGGLAAVASLLEEE